MRINTLHKLFVLALLVTTPLLSQIEGSSSHTARKAALDIGSGTIRICIANVSVKDNIPRIYKIFAEKKQEIPFANEAGKNNNILDEAIYQQALSTLHKFKKLSDENGVQKIIGVATDIFRKASNGTEFIERLSRESGIDIRIISQDKEGELGFLTVSHVANTFNPPIDAERMVAWDNGNSSMQLSALQKGSMVVYKSPFGLFPVEEALAEVRMNMNGSAPKEINPISLEEADQLTAYLIQRSPEASNEMLDAIRNGTVVRKHGNGIFPALFKANDKKVITKIEVQETIEKFLGKTDKEINHIVNLGEESETVLLRLITLYAIMEKFDIPAVRCAKVTSGNTYGIFLDTSLWD